MKLKKFIRDRKKLILYLTLVGTSLFFFIFIITATWIGYDIREKCEASQQKYGGDCVEALITYLKDEQNPVQERSSAAWALGQLGDEMALPTLLEYYDGSECDHSTKLCQYELKKAIDLISNGTNITAFIWRGNIVKK